MTTLLTWLCAAGALCVFGRMIHSVATYRASPQDPSTAPKNKVIEVAWTAIPIIIMVASGLFAIGV